MEIKTYKVELEETNGNDVVNITGKVEDYVKKSGLKEGSVLIFNQGSTAGITTLEYEPGLQKDLPEAFNRLAPKDIRYGHEERWHDGNGHSHVKASILKPGIEIPFTKGKLLTGTWQQIVLMEFDNKPRHRTIIIQVKGK